MTVTQLHAKAELALLYITAQAQSREHVYASRRGLVAAAKDGSTVLVFRRVEGRVRFEFWPPEGSRKKPIVQQLTEDMEQKAAQLLDRL